MVTDRERLARIITEQIYGKHATPQEAADAIIADGYERRRDHAAEQDEIRKQVRG